MHFHKLRSLLFERVSEVLSEFSSFLCFLNFYFALLQVALFKLLTCARMNSTEFKQQQRLSGQHHMLYFHVICPFFVQMLKGIWLEKVHIGTLPGKQVLETSAEIEFSFRASWTWQSIWKNCKHPLLLNWDRHFARYFWTVLHTFQYICSYLANAYLTITVVFL